MHRLKIAQTVLICGLVGVHSAAWAQDDATKVLLENEQVRVIEMRFKPGAKIESLSHRNRFVYALTDGALVFKPAGKTAYELSFKAGEALWLPAQSSGTENDTDKEVRALVVDLKEMPSPARGPSRAKAPKKAASSDAGTPKPAARNPAKTPAKQSKGGS